jgi:hypothetical protein
VLAGAGSAAVRAVAVMPTSGRRVVSVPIDGAPRADRRATASAAHASATRRAAERIAVPVHRPVDAAMMAPWGEPDPVPGVVMRTSLVPSDWLRPTPPATTPPTVMSIEPAVPARPQRTAAQPSAAPPPVRPVPTSVRIRKAAMMAFGLLVSLVAVEAAARVGRR